MKRKISVVLLFLLVLAPLQSLAKELIPMGNSIGVQLQMPYVFVSHDVLLQSGEWLKQGERVTKVNDKKVTNVEMLLSQDSAVKITIENAGKARDLTITNEQLVHLKPFLKSETDGIGTLTFIDPATMEYGALGHQIVDMVLKQPPSFTDGAIYEASISQVKKSVPGQPGYKISIVDHSLIPLGSVMSNDVYGIFGNWEQTLQQSLHQPLEIIHADQLKKGKAEMLTSIDGGEVESFTIEIGETEGNQFTFHVTDKRLIEKTGGIIQGMSGSPIVQNNQFVGAVTHMFVEEPTKGAGIFIIEMLKKTPN